MISFFLPFIAISISQCLGSVPRPHSSQRTPTLTASRACGLQPEGESEGRLALEDGIERDMPVVRDSNDRNQTEQ